VARAAYTAREKGAGHSINFRSLSLEVFPAWVTGKPIEVWFQDEARVGQKGSIEYV
jgi:hypothetical protein